MCTTRSGRSRAPSEPVTLTWETKSTCSVMFAAATQLRSCISPHAPRTCGRLSAETSVPVWSRRRPTSALIDSNICRVCPCVVRRSCSSRATSSLTRRRFCAIGIQAPLDLLRALPELPGGGRAIGLPLRRRELLEPFGDLPRRRLRARGAQVRELPLVRGPGDLQLDAGRTLALPGASGLVDGGAQPRHQQDRQRRGTGDQPEDEHREAHDASLAMVPDGVHARLQAAYAPATRRDAVAGASSFTRGAGCSASGAPVQRTRSPPR